MAQGFGYLLACVGPVALGAIHNLTGGWAVPTSSPVTARAR
jgi:CP family cyanate transporter-like MFS transporter